jgi:hypothetical protein
MATTLDIDPTRMTTIRGRLMIEIRQRFKNFAKHLNKSLLSQLKLNFCKMAFHTINQRS